jgi:hypothetical protein
MLGAVVEEECHKKANVGKDQKTGVLGIILVPETAMTSWQGNVLCDISIMERYQAGIDIQVMIMNRQSALIVRRSASIR